MAQICYQFNGFADCEGCCGACGSCSMIPISTSPPHDEDNCEARPQAYCDASTTPGGGGGLGPDDALKHARSTQDIYKALDRVFVKRMQELANIKKK